MREFQLGGLLIGSLGSGLDRLVLSFGSPCHGRYTIKSAPTGGIHVICLMIRMARVSFMIVKYKHKLDIIIIKNAIISS